MKRLLALVVSLVLLTACGATGTSSVQISSAGAPTDENPLLGTWYFPLDGAAPGRLSSITLEEDGTAYYRIGLYTTEANLQYSGTYQQEDNQVSLTLPTVETSEDGYNIPDYSYTGLYFVLRYAPLEDGAPAVVLVTGQLVTGQAPGDTIPLYTQEQMYKMAQELVDAYHASSQPATA